MSEPSPVTTRIEHRVAVITTDAPPINTLGAGVRAALADSLHRLAADKAVDAIVVMCGGRGFFAGADINEFGKAPIEPSLRQIIAIVEDSPKPVIAAIHGVALGGGLELAMAAHYRIATQSATFGLPEVKIGILPGAGGTQRLPRLVGAERALQMITSGDAIGSDTAFAAGLIDAAVDDTMLADAALDFARRVIADRRTAVLARDRTPLAEDRAAMFATWRNSVAKRQPHLDAPMKCIDAVEAAFTLPFDEGVALERTLFDTLVAGKQAKALRYLFFAERLAKKADPTAAGAVTRPVHTVGVVGAGTMGGGIAMTFANAGIATTIIDTAPEGLARGLAVIAQNYERSVKRGSLAPDERNARMSRITGSLAFEDLATVDLVIEAVYEDLSVKCDVFARLDAIMRPGAILATNTSYLDVDAIAASTGRPADVLGLHFFSPANVMKLLEIVRAEQTAPDVVATAVELARTIGKVGVTVRNGFGFVGNRILAARNRQADRVVLEGATPAQVDAVLRDFGFPMGHFQMRDLVGLDVGWTKGRSNAASVRDTLCEMGRLGQKSGGGYYDYDADRRATPASAALDVIHAVARQEGLSPRQVGDEEILDRLLLAMVSEGARIIDEGIALRASDIDVIWVTGYGWPRYRGGPMFWADTRGLPRLSADLERLAASYGEDFTPSPLIGRLIADGKSFTASPGQR